MSGAAVLQSTIDQATVPSSLCRAVVDRIATKFRTATHSIDRESRKNTTHLEMKRADFDAKKISL